MDQKLMDQEKQVCVKIGYFVVIAYIICNVFI